MFVGSFNVVPRSVALNTEMGVLFESPELATRLGKSFDEDVGQMSYQLKLITVPSLDDEDDFYEGDIQWITKKDGKNL
jgi:putative cardiolipin synthase